jgi:hypothetical protein
VANLVPAIQLYCTSSTGLCPGSSARMKCNIYTFKSA